MPSWKKHTPQLINNFIQFNVSFPATETVYHWGYTKFNILKQFPVVQLVGLQTNYYICSMSRRQWVWFYFC